MDVPSILNGHGRRIPRVAKELGAQVSPESCCETCVRVTGDAWGKSWSTRTEQRLQRPSLEGGLSCKARPSVGAFEPWATLAGPRATVTYRDIETLVHTGSLLFRPRYVVRNQGSLEEQLEEGGTRPRRNVTSRVHTEALSPPRRLGDARSFLSCLALLPTLNRISAATQAKSSRRELHVELR
jgi:hypothetical protein